MVSLVQENGPALGSSDIYVDVLKHWFGEGTYMGFSVESSERYKGIRIDICNNLVRVLLLCYFGRVKYGKHGVSVLEV